MHIINTNPYRVTGLLVGTTAKEQKRQIKRLKQYISAQKEPQDDFSFPILGSFNRTIEKVNEANSKLNLDNDKIDAALFWFYNGNPITDEPAFDSLKAGKIKNAISIWARLTNDKVVDKSNASAFHNLSTVILHSTFSQLIIKEVLFEKGLRLKLKFLDSEFANDLKILATDITYKTSNKKLQLIFLNELLAEIVRNEGISTFKVLEIIKKQEFSAKEDFLKEIVQSRVKNIEEKIEDAKKRSKKNREKAAEYGSDLYAFTKSDLTLLISILGTSEITIVSISDKLANEIVQCSIMLFNHFYETGTEVGEIVLELNKKAKSIALGSVVKNRIDESNQIVEIYIKNRPKRENQHFEKETILNLLNPKDSDKSHIENMRLNLGLKDE